MLKKRQGRPFLGVIAAINVGVVFLMFGCLHSSARADDTSRNQDSNISQAIQSKIDNKLSQYTTLVKSRYTENSRQTSDSLASSQQELSIAIHEADDTFSTYQKIGFDIEQASVSAEIKHVDVEEMGTSGMNQFIVSATLNTELKYRYVDEFFQEQHDSSNWSDKHQYALTWLDSSSMNAIDGSLQIVADTRLPEDDVNALQFLPAVNAGVHTMSTEEALQKANQFSVERIKPRTAGATPAIPKYMDAVRYALKWTSPPYDGDDREHFNPNYPYLENNCTNFVSQSLHEAGVSYSTSLIPYPKDTSIWTPDVIFGKPSWTWDNADYNYKFMSTHYYKPATTLFLPEGSLIYANWDPRKDETFDHMMIVTESKRVYDHHGQMNFVPSISQKTRNRHNIPLEESMRKAHEDHPLAQWAGLVMRWNY